MTIHFEKDSPQSNVIDTMVRVELVGDDCDQSFLKTRETLKRIGIGVEKLDGTKTLYQSCHILHKRGQYYICHFKQMLALDGRKSDIDDLDLTRVKAVSNYLHQWGLVKVLDDALIEHIPTRRIGLRIIKFQERDQWILKAKHDVADRKL